MNENNAFIGVYPAENGFIVRVRHPYVRRSKRRHVREQLVPDLENDDIEDLIPLNGQARIYIAKTIEDVLEIIKSTKAISNGID